MFRVTSKKLSNWKDKGETEKLARIFKEHNMHESQIVKEAIFALAEIGDASAYSILKDGLTKSNPYYSTTANALMRMMSGEQAATLFLESDIAGLLKGEIIKIGQPAVKPLLNILQEKYSKKRSLCVSILGEIGDNSTIPTLSMLLDEKNSTVSPRLVADALSKFGSKGVTQLINALNKGNYEAREDIIEVLGNCGDNRATKPIMSKFTEIVSRPFWQMGSILEVFRAGDTVMVKCIQALKMLNVPEKEIMEPLVDELNASEDERKIVAITDIMKSAEINKLNKSFNIVPAIKFMESILKKTPRDKTRSTITDYDDGYGGEGPTKKVKNHEYLRIDDSLNYLKKL